MFEYVCVGVHVLRRCKRASVFRSSTPRMKQRQWRWVVVVVFSPCLEYKQAVLFQAKLVLGGARGKKKLRTASAQERKRRNRRESVGKIGEVVEYVMLRYLLAVVVAIVWEGGRKGREGVGEIRVAGLVQCATLGSQQWVR